jgi:hypothetical protein
MVFKQLKKHNLMKPSEKCKAAGLKNLLELSTITGKPVQTLIRWYEDDPVFFEILLRGAVSKKHCAAFDS